MQTVFIILYFIFFLDQFINILWEKIVEEEYFADKFRNVEIIDCLDLSMIY